MMATTTTLIPDILLLLTESHTYLVRGVVDAESFYKYITKQHPSTSFFNMCWKFVAVLTTENLCISPISSLLHAYISQRMMTITQKSKPQYQRARLILKELA